MRVLAACTDCARQYDVSHKPEGSSFHCYCGSTVQVTAAASFDASVIRCSACAGVRDKSESNCRYCGAAFTLMEQELHTVCPGCFARISDNGRFCHHCAMAIAPQRLEDSPAGYDCPACGPGYNLFSRELGTSPVNALECNQCAGIWLNHRLFELLEERAQQRLAPGQAQRFLDHRGKLSQPQDPHGKYYRDCPQCGQMMQRRNYGPRSGVLIDVCRHHGVWFDLGELDRILRWVRTGGLKQARGQVKKMEQAQQRTDRLLAAMDRNRDALIAPGPGASSSSPFLDALVDYFFR